MGFVHPVSPSLKPAIQKKLVIYNKRLLFDCFQEEKNKKSINHLPFRKSQMQPPHFQTVFFGTPVSNSEEKDNLINNSMPICNFEQHMVLTFEIQYRRKKEKLKKID